MSSIESGYSPEGAGEWKAPRIGSTEVGHQRMEMKIVPEISISVALEEIKKENETAVKTSESMEIDMPLVNLLPQLEDRLFDENKMGDPAFTELVDRIIDRLSPKGHLSKGHKMLLDSLHKLKEKSGAEDVDAAA